MKEISEAVALVANLMTIGASGIAIYLFIWKRKYISTALNVLVSYGMQLTLSELTEKLDELNDLRANDDVQRAEIVNILHEIIGQMKGNPKLASHFRELIDRIEKTTSGKSKISEQSKRSIVSEIRERIRHVGIMSIENVAGEGK